MRYSNTINKLNIVNVSISRARDYLIVLMPDDVTENVDNLTLVKKVERLCKLQTIWNLRFKIGHMILHNLYSFRKAGGGVVP